MPLDAQSTQPSVSPGVAPIYLFPEDTWNGGTDVGWGEAAGLKLGEREAGEE